jgi:hypothetical protein
MVDKSQLIQDTTIKLRDYLRANLTDPKGRSGSEWIFTSMPRREVDKPFIVVEQDGLHGSAAHGVSGAVISDRPRVVKKIEVWARNMKERDELTGQILDKLYNDGGYFVSVGMEEFNVDNGGIPRSVPEDLSARIMTLFVSYKVWI